MGFDITLHPISVEEIRRFVFDPLEDRSLVENRVCELTKDEEKIDFIKENYEFTFNNCIKNCKVDCNKLSVLAAKVSSFLHPYWYSRNLALSFLIQDEICKPVIRPLSVSIENGDLKQRLIQPKLLIEENYSSSGFILPEDTLDLSDNLIDSIKQQAEILKEKTLAFQNKNKSFLSYLNIQFSERKTSTHPFEQPLKKITDLLEDDQTLWGICQALAYCKTHNLGLIESSDLVVPMSGDFYCNPDNLRATFLQKSTD